MIRNNQCSKLFFSNYIINYSCILFAKVQYSNAKRIQEILHGHRVECDILKAYVPFKVILIARIHAAEGHTGVCDAAHVHRGAHALVAVDLTVV